MHSLDFVACTAQRPRIRLAASISSGASAIREAKRTANPLDPHEGRVQESTGGLDWSTLFSGAAVKKIKMKKTTTTSRGHCVQKKTKICTDDLDDILIFYFGFHWFSQPNAGVDTNLWIRFKVFIISSERFLFFNRSLFLLKGQKKCIVKEPYKNCRLARWGRSHIPLTQTHVPPPSPPSQQNSTWQVHSRKCAFRYILAGLLQSGCILTVCGWSYGDGQQGHIIL